MKKIARGCLIFPIVLLSACGGGSGAGSLNANSAPLPAVALDAVSAKASADQAAKLAGLVARFARGATLLQGHLREGAFPSGTVVTAKTNDRDGLSSRSSSVPRSTTAGCPVITEPDTLLSSGFTITADWGDSGCVDGIDGVQRHGKITVDLSDLVLNVSNGDLNSGTATLGFSNFGTTSQSVAGTVVAKIISPTLENWNLNIAYSGDVSGTLLATTTVTSTADSDIETINGEGTLTSAGTIATVQYDGVQFDHDYDKSSLQCAYPIGGKLKLSGTNKAEIKYDLDQSGCGFAQQSTNGETASEIYLGQGTPATDISVSNGTNSEYVQTNNWASYGVNFTNNGIIAAHNVQLTVSVEGIDSVNLRSDNGLCDASKRTCTFTWRTVNPRTYLSANVEVNFSTAGSANVSRLVSSSVADPNNANNSYVTSVAISTYVASGPVDNSRTIKLDTPSLPINGTSRLMVVDQNGYPDYSSNTWNWASSNTDVLSIDSNGQVTGKATGTANITAERGGTRLAPATISVTTDKISVVNLATNDLIYDATHQKLLVTVPSSAGFVGNAVIGNTVSVINPVTAKTELSVFAGSEPSTLAIADDGSKVYAVLNGANAIVPVTISVNNGQLALAPGSIFGFAAGQNGETSLPNDIEVVPGRPDALVVAGERIGVAVYDSGVVRPARTPDWPGAISVAFSADPSVLYGYNYYGAESPLSRMTIDTQGVSQPSVVSSGLTRSDRFTIVAAGNRIYASNGQVVSMTDGAGLGKFNLPQGTTSLSFCVDAAKRRAYFLVSENNPQNGGQGYAVQAFDTEYFVPTGKFSVSIPTYTSGYYPPSNVSGLLRWGTDGLAFRATDGKVVIINWAAVAVP